jgi:hypothetical protein
MNWQLSYFNHWLSHYFYFIIITLLIVAWGSNQIIKYKRKKKILKRLKKYSFVENIKEELAK